MSLWFAGTGLMRPFGASLDCNTHTMNHNTPAGMPCFQLSFRFKSTLPGYELSYGLLMSYVML